MPRQDHWIPKTAEERVEKLEAIEQIRQLPHRYALGLDTRNLDDMVELFVEDVRVGRDKVGRQAMKEWFAKTFTSFGDSIHFVGNHVIDFDSPDRARGIVTCQDQLEKKPEWHVGLIQYWDQYERHGGRWYFRFRKLHRWYIDDALRRPSHGAGMEADRQNMSIHPLPDAWPTWGKFWQERGRSPR